MAEPKMVDRMFDEYQVEITDKTKTVVPKTRKEVMPQMILGFFASHFSQNLHNWIRICEISTYCSQLQKRLFIIIGMNSE